MEVSRNLENIGLISKQFKKETHQEFDLNKLIKWLGSRTSIKIDEDLI